MPGSIVDLAQPGRQLPTVVVVDTSLLVERLLASYFDDLPPSPVVVNAERTRWFFQTLTGVGGVGLVTPTAFAEFVHAAIRSRYKAERQRLGPAIVQRFGRPAADWLALYKLDQAILHDFLPELQELSRRLIANGLLIVAPDDFRPLAAGRSHHEELVRIVARYGLDSGDASILLEAQRVGVTDIVTLDADLRRAQADFTIYTWL